MALLNFNAGCPIPLRPSVLLHPQIPKPMHTMAPRVVLGQEWWDRERKEAYNSTRQHCIACGVHQSKALVKQWMEAHELYEIDYSKGRMVYIESIPLCHLCHNFIHFGRVCMVYGEDSDFAYQVKKHGLKVLGMRKLPITEIKGGVADWEDWRLVIGDNEYKGKFNSYQEWQTFFSR